LANIGVLVGLLAIYLTEQYWLDGAISLLIALFIIKAGVKIIRKSIWLLLDHEADENVKIKIIEVFQIFLQQKKINGFHFLRTRQSGSKVLIDAHVVFTPKILLVEAHQVSDEIEMALKKKIGLCDVLIHLDPVDDSYAEQHR
jgi:cation diffusion facilitator family transporter